MSNIDVENIAIHRPEDRPDRLVAITGQHSGDLVSEYSLDGCINWQPSTIDSAVLRLRNPSNDKIVFQKRVDLPEL